MPARSPGTEGATLSVVRMREATVDDATAIEAVHYASREAVYRGRVAQWPPDRLSREDRTRRWRTWLSSPSIDCWVVEDDGAVVAFVTLRASTDPDADPARVAEMPTLYVHPDSWRSGLGTGLCREAFDAATHRGFAALTLWVLDINEQARSFYEALGFEADGASKIDESSAEGLVAHRYRISLPVAST